jgi:ethanolamine utilization protein EutN
MLLAEVIGSVVADQHHSGYDGHPLLMVRSDAGEAIIAVDRMGAGLGEMVLVLREGNGVRQLLGGEPPIRSVIIAIVDAVERAQ